MKLCMIGTGYVGLVSGVCFSDVGNKVYCVDKDKKKIDFLNSGKVPIYEPGLEEILKKNHKQKRLIFTSDLKKAVINSDIIFICVGTPNKKKSNSAELKYVFSVVQQLKKIIKSYKIIITKSTVPVTTGDKIENILSNLKKRKLVDVVSNPEFLKEGVAIADFMKPDRVIVGSDSESAIDKIKKLYHPFCMSKDKFISMDIRSAEMTKYAANAMLATKISFMNEIANICEKVGADASQVRIGIGSDKRIGYSFIQPGIGYGGSCFPKDVKALIEYSKEIGSELTLLNKANNINNNIRAQYNNVTVREKEQNIKFNSKKKE